jgi:endonuclease/exonuclease/phosphatase (EEP) superfamily protein YafD
MATTTPLAILENGLIDQTRWAVLSRDLPRTYSGSEKPAFANKAIDHIATPLQFLGRFTLAERGDDKLGSDHFPVFTHYRAQP